MTEDLDYLPRDTLAYASARFGLALRLAMDHLRRAALERVSGWRP